jgi:hypothetical protein
MQSSITKMTSTHWINAVGILKPLGRRARRYQSESVFWKRTDNTMAKRKSTKGQITIVCRALNETWIYALNEVAVYILVQITNIFSFNGESETDFYR